VKLSEAAAKEATSASNTLQATIHHLQNYLSEAREENDQLVGELESCQCRAESSVAAAEEATTLTTSLHAIVQHMREDLSVSSVRIAKLESKDETSRETIRNLKKEVRSKGVEASLFQSRVGELEKESAKLMMQLDAANLTKVVMAREL